MQRRGSLQRKLVVLVAASIAIATLVSTAIALWQQSLSYVDSRRQALVTTAQVFAAASARATAAQDREAAYVALRGMGRVPDIHYAEIRSSSGRMLAGFGAVERLVDDVSVSGHQNVSFWRMLRTGTIEVSVPIVDGGLPIGQFILIGSLPELRSQLVATAALAAGGGGVALLVGLLVAWRFQDRITRPLRTLIGAMAQVGAQKRYDVAVEQANDREIGELVDGFNRMLGDIRERDERLEAHARNLEDEVKARTADLRIARDAAEAANRAKSDFLATMSHEIRTPMNGIMVMADLLVQAELPRRQQRFADVIARSGKSLLAIINDILDFSKIEAGKLELERLPVDLNALAENVTSLFAERAREKGLDLAAFVDPALPHTITSDPVRLGQVISNLVNNALKFTEKGSVGLRVSPADRGLRIAVSDTGIGIAREKLGSIFESFSQADQSTTRNFGGTGLGLTISQRLVHALGGEITVESDLGQGSTFSVLLPIEGASAAPAWPRLTAARAGTGCVIDVSGDATRATLTAYLAASGHAVTHGEAGAARAHGILCADVEKLSSHRTGGESAPILIAVCAQGDSRGEELVAAGKAHACLTRPVLRSEVEALLARIVAGERVLQPAAQVRAAAPVAGFKSFRALVADDNAVNLEVASEALAQLNATVVTVENGREAVDAAAAGGFDIIFMDGSMPVMDGFAAARTIRAAEGSGVRVPIVALTAHVVGAAAEEWRDAGMDTVVHKPFTVATLARTIETLLPQLRGEAEASAPAPAPVHQPDDDAAIDAAVLDQLRQLEANGKVGFARRVLGLYAEHAPEAIAQIRSAAQAGDAAACARAAHALKSMSYNVGARPMAALAAEIEGLGKLQARVPDDRMLGSLDSTLARTIEAIGRQPELSGVNLTPAPGAAPAPVPAPPPAEETLEQALAHAIERNELTVQYQPIVDRGGGTTVAVEALLRWQRNGKFISPAEFIPLAEKSGSIHAIGAWVLRQACLDARGWNVALSVNVSAVQFGAPGLSWEIERIVAKTGFPLNRLELEITETALLTAEEAVLRTMRRLREKGVAFALDDFGIGYSSLTYLRRFPFDKLKIDRTFIADIGMTVNATIVHAVVSIGRSLGLKLVAEGVENSDQHRFLATAGVHYLQGYLFGRPAPDGAIAERLAAERAPAKSA